MTFIAKISIPWVDADGGRISGTRVIPTPSGAAYASGSTDGDPIGAVKIEIVQIKVGGVAIIDDTFTGTLGSPSSAPAQGLKALDQPYFRAPIFASTHFDHGTTVEVEAKVKWIYKRLSGATGEQWVSAKINPTAYNRATIWRTDVNENGIPLIPQYLAYIQDTEDEVLGLLQDCKYAVSNTLLTKTQIVGSVPPSPTAPNPQGDVGISTSIIGMTHAGFSGVEDSYGGDISWSDFWYAIGDRYQATSPMRPNSTLLIYACQTFMGGSPSFDSTDFWQWKVNNDPNLPLLNALLCGFDASYAFGPEESQHIDTVRQYVNAGHTLSYAIRKANDDTPIPKLNGSKTDPIARLRGIGDVLATVRFCWVPASVRKPPGAPEEIAYINWYYVPPF